MISVGNALKQFARKPKLFSFLFSSFFLSTKTVQCWPENRNHLFGSGSVTFKEYKCLCFGTSQTTQYFQVRQIRSQIDHSRKCCSAKELAKNPFCRFILLVWPIRCIPMGIDTDLKLAAGCKGAVTTGQFFSCNLDVSQSLKAYQA